MGDLSRQLIILVTDDSDDVRSVVTLILKARGHEVFGATDGKDAERLLRQRHFDVVISDILMPEADGFELIGTIKALQPQARIIMTSGGGFLSPEDDSLAIAVRLGAHAVIRKPFTSSELVKVVEASRGRESTAGGQ